MSDLWLYTPEICDGDYCPMDCDHCYKSDLAMEAQAEGKKMAEYIERDKALTEQNKSMNLNEMRERLKRIPAADVRPVPAGGIGEMSDGYHTFNGLYYQRMVLFAALVKAYKNKAWKSWKHEDGGLCFGGGWFIVGIDTPQGSYTYHYEAKDFDLFDCEELPVAKHWDGHTEADVTRLLSLQRPPKEE